MAIGLRTPPRRRRRQVLAGDTRRHKAAERDRADPCAYTCHADILCCPQSRPDGRLATLELRRSLVASGASDRIYTRKRASGKYGNIPDFIPAPQNGGSRRRTDRRMRGRMQNPDRAAFETVARRQQPPTKSPNTRAASVPRLGAAAMEPYAAGLHSIAASFGRRVGSSAAGQIIRRSRWPAG